MLKVMKQIMSKADQAREDAHLAMLAYRVTPRGPEKLSPAEAMTQYKFRALLPVKQHLSAWIDESREIMIQQKQRQVEYYDCIAELQQNQSVHVQLDPGQPTWQRAVVTGTSTGRNSRAYQA